MAFAKPNTNLSPLLNQWKILLQQWAKGGSLVTAAKEALLLSGIPEGLQILIDEWSAADFNSLPEIELLSAADINGALGAYAISTGKIYLNENWLEGASNADVFDVLTEELGHHLDGLFNAVDTPGDEGALFAALLTSNFNVSDSEKESLQAEADHGIAMIFGNEVAVEQSGLPEVSVAATANGKETDGSPVVFTFNRTGSTAAALSIEYQLFGTAQAGSDYTGNTTGLLLVQIQVFLSALHHIGEIIQH